MLRFAQGTCTAAAAISGAGHEARTLLNLGRDTEGLEERRLGGVEGGGAGGDVDVALRDRVGARRGRLPELLDDLLHDREVVAHEEEADVADELRQQGAPGVVLLVLAVQADAALHEGVLAHEDLAVMHANGLQQGTYVCESMGQRQLNGV